MNNFCKRQRWLFKGFYKSSKKGKFYLTNFCWNFLVYLVLQITTDKNMAKILTWFTYIVAHLRFCKAKDIHFIFSFLLQGIEHSYNQKIIHFFTNFFCGISIIVTTLNFDIGNSFIQHLYYPSYIRYTICINFHI